MKSISIKILIVFIGIVSFYSCKQDINTTNSSTSKESVINYISPLELYKVIDTVQLVDIRTPREFSGGHIRNAKNINYGSSNFISEMSKLDKNKPVYIYCLSGSRSRSASKKLKSAGFTKVYDLQGGIRTWYRNKLEISK